jgi:SMC interacting uncharacterized protein involved in chromosome segregation
MEAQVANAFNKLLEEYDETTKIRENRENLIMKFKLIKDQNENFKDFMTLFRENEKEFANKLKQLKIELEEKDQNTVKKKRFSASSLIDSESKKRSKSSTGIRDENKKKKINITCGLPIPGSIKKGSEKKNLTPIAMPR